MAEAYMNSPVGILYLQADAESINELSFVNSWKGKKVDEKEISFKKPRSPVLKKCIKQLEEYFAGKRKQFELSLSQTGTEFQISVWKQLLTIPYGRTISYHTLSKQLGNVKAIRAAGTANGSNHISIIVPCHRVIGSNGDLIGYGGDLWRKQWLLEHEAKHENGVQMLF
jgi:methylated-DNA-[protein]-cysteine S-methyltransferase